LVLALREQRRQVDELLSPQGSSATDLPETAPADRPRSDWTSTNRMV